MVGGAEGMPGADSPGGAGGACMGAENTQIK